MDLKDMHNTFDEDLTRNEGFCQWLEDTEYIDIEEFLEYPKSVRIKIYRDYQDDMRRFTRAAGRKRF